MTIKENAPSGNEAPSKSRENAPTLQQHTVGRNCEAVWEAL